MSNISELSKIKAGKALWMLAALIIVIAGLREGKEFFLPILLAAFVATISFPLLNFLREKRVPRPLAVILTVAVDFVFLAALAVLAVTLVGDLQENGTANMLLNFPIKYARRPDP